MNRFAIKCNVAVLLLGVAVSSAAETPVNLSTLEGVMYTYVAADGTDLGAKAFNDTTGRFLADGDPGGSGNVTTVYQEGSAKRIAARFTFPLGITPQRVDVLWMWPFNAKQWIDRFKVYVGDDPSKLTLAGEVKPTRVGGNSTTIPIDLKPVQGRYVMVVAEQDAHVEHFMMGLGEIGILASPQDANRLRAAEKPAMTIDVPRHVPCNLFDIGEPVKLKAVIDSNLTGKGKLRLRLTNYFEDVLDEQTLDFQVQPMAPVEIPLPLDIHEPGYFEVDLSAEIEVAGKTRTLSAKRKVSLGVAPLGNRTGVEAIAAGSRFGIVGNSAEGQKALRKLGIQWCRGLFCWAPLAAPTATERNWDQVNNWIDMIEGEIQSNVILEIKSIPTHTYDLKRYEGKKNVTWAINTVPLAEPWKAFIREQIAHVKPELLDRVYFEIWNEPHGKMSAKEFAELAQMTLQGIRAVHPKGRVGTNIDPMAYLDIVLEAGGMKDMDFLSVHPYSTDFVGSPEQTGLRTRIRSYRALLRKHLGRDLPILVSEIGWATPAQGPFHNTKRRQAQCIARAAMGLYAEDVKVFTPYILKLGEQANDDREAHFGFIHNNEEPKPVFLTYATAARMIDCSRFVGDLWFGRDVGAMLFERGGVYTLALFSDDMTKHILVRPGVKELKIVDAVGHSRTVHPRNGKLSLTVTSDPIYLVGVSPELAKNVRDITPEELWSQLYKRESRVNTIIATQKRLAEVSVEGCVLAHSASGSR